MDQERKNLQYTNNVKSEVEVEEDIDFYLDAESVKNHELCATIIPFNTKRNCFSDLTGAFPHKSIRGNLYVMVMYAYDSNAILAETIKTGRQQPSVMRSSSFIRSWKQEADNRNFTLWTTSVLLN